jgi:hypothetical protein
VPIYKKFVKKTHKLQSKYAKFNLHPRSLDGSTASLEEIRKELGFHDVNTALANIIEALENATAAPKKKKVAKVDITSLLKEAIAKGNQSLKRELKVDIKTLKEDILANSHFYTDIMTQDMRSKIDGQFTNKNN